ncbi:uncharacterized protein LOC132719876 [Ruditapes philippinarum]|uniref:uncharacterized protein LOC132719876 n=1 Tax=Ruditapes philippinarum TaxID=129788 RepID=UPI00295B519C|nr:uncharacterized protein LOC132719876 [Ruditapes philippinarum]
MDFTKLFYSLFVSSFIVSSSLFLAEGCDFPSSWTGTWYSSRRGALIINSTTISDINTTLTGPLTYTCFMNSADTYVIRSELFTLHNALHRAYFCLEFSEITKGSLVYYHTTRVNPQAYNERLKAYPSISSVTKLDICDDTPDITSWEMLVKQGSFEDAEQDCPNDIRGQYNYTLTMSSSTTCGLGNSSLDVCTDVTKPTVNMSLCSTPVAFSAGGLLQCAFSHSIDSYTYTFLLNLDNTTDEATTFRFTCLVSVVSGTLGDYTYATQYPQLCHSSQTPTSVPSAGGSLVMLPSECCGWTMERHLRNVCDDDDLAHFVIAYLL